MKISTLFLVGYSCAALNLSWLSSVKTPAAELEESFRAAPTAAELEESFRAALRAALKKGNIPNAVELEESLGAALNGAELEEIISAALRDALKKGNTPSDAELEESLRAAISAALEKGNTIAPPELKPTDVEKGSVWSRMRPSQNVKIGLGALTAGAVGGGAVAATVSKSKSPESINVIEPSGNLNAGATPPEISF